MLPDRVSNPGPLTYESGALPIALRGPATIPKIGIVLEGKKFLSYNQRNTVGPNGVDSIFFSNQ